MASNEHGECLRAAFVVAEDGIRRDAAVEIDDGCIRRIVDASTLPAERCTDLGDVALVPGRVNAHSHAFQRAIRGRTEYLEAARRDDDFWSWREKMYRAALSLDADDFERVARFAFLEMLEAGFTSVGEFHYVHHAPDGTPYDNPNELAERIARAGASVGLRVHLLRAAYHRSGYQTDPNPRQRRFLEPDLQTYLDRFDRLASFAEDRPRVEVGLAPHSIRAVPGEWLEGIAEFADANDLPVHIHASEQRAELDESREEYGTTPIEAFERLGLLEPRVTIIHATHATDREIELMADRGCIVCACPTTERNLGDGFLEAEKLVEHGIPICLGSDSHADIDPWKEMRLVEYHERLREERRNILAGREENAGGRIETAETLWPMGGRNGARALGADEASLRPGSPADLVAVDLDHVALRGASTEHLLAHLVFSTPPSAVSDVFVGGDHLIDDGEHPRSEEISAAFEETIRRID